MGTLRIQRADATEIPPENVQKLLARFPSANIDTEGLRWVVEIEEHTWTQEDGAFIEALELEWDWNEESDEKWWKKYGFSGTTVGSGEARDQGIPRRVG